MKLLLSLAASLTLVTNIFSQGTVNFANGGAGVNAPINYPPAGGPLISTANGPWLAMLYAGPAGSPEELLSSTIVSGSPAAAGAPSAGYVFGGGRTISGIPPGSQATLQIRVWAADVGASWEAAGGPAGQPRTGRTLPITITLGGGPTPTPNMVGLSGMIWDTPLIPEPSSVFVGILGVIVIVGVRRIIPPNTPSN